MVQAIRKIPITQIILDAKIYSKSGIYPKRVSMFAENMRDGFKIDPIEVQIHPDDDNKYRILDGAHRLNAYNEIGATEIPIQICKRKANESNYFTSRFLRIGISRFVKRKF